MKHLNLKKQISLWLKTGIRSSVLPLWKTNNAQIDFCMLLLRRLWHLPTMKTARYNSFFLFSQIPSAINVISSWLSRIKATPDHFKTLILGSSFHRETWNWCDFVSMKIWIYYEQWVWHWKHLRWVHFAVNFTG